MNNKYYFYCINQKIIKIIKPFILKKKKTKKNLFKNNLM